MSGKCLHRVDVIVVGAGLCGLSAATRLLQAGFKIQVLEKSDRLAGRLDSSEPQSIHQDNLGAQYFTARDKAFRRQVEHWQHAGVVAAWPFSPYTFDKQLSPSPDAEQRFIGQPCMGSIAAALAQKVNVRFNDEVTAITETQDGYLVRSRKKNWLCQHVVVTTPAKITRYLLPQFAAEIPKDALLPVWAVNLTTEMLTTQQIQGIFVANEKTTWLAQQSAKPPQKQHTTQTWLLHFSPHWSQDNVHISKAELEQICRTLLERILGAKVGKVFDMTTKLWENAAYNKQHPPINRLLVDGNILAAGDWLLGGRIENAWLMGQRAANHILQEMVTELKA